MRAGDVVKTAVRSLKGSLSRSLLTVLGLGIGVGACIAIGSLGEAAVRTVRTEMEQFGVDRIWIADAPGNRTLLGEKDVALLGRQAGSACAVCRETAQAHYGARSKVCQIVATEEAYARIENITLASGRFLLAQDAQNLLRTAVIEDILKEELFGKREAVGEKIRIGENTFTVVGVVRTAESAYFAVESSAPRVYVPLSAFCQLTGREHYDEIILRTNGGSIPETAQRVKALLKSSRAETDAFVITSLYEQIASADRILGIVTTVLAVVGIICMITGGVGVMNVMLTGIRERRGEIGLRKALGARDDEIFCQFLCESVLYGVSGALFGILLGGVMTNLGKSVIGVEAHMVPWVAVCAVLFACLVGAVCGVYPALRAARISPVSAMRRT